MSWELEELKIKIRSLEWQKAEAYKVDALKNDIIQLQNQVTNSLNLISSLTDKVSELNNYVIRLEQRLDNPFTGI
jgi:ribosomal protein S4